VGERIDLSFCFAGGVEGDGRPKANWGVVIRGMERYEVYWGFNPG
jgi:hypothetical protein